MKKILLTGLLLSVSLGTASVFAETTADVVLPLAPEISVVTSVSEKEEMSISTTRISKLKTQGERLIKERLATLESNKKTIDANKSLTGDQKVALDTFITTNTTGLTTVRASIAASSDATSTKALIKSIFTDFRIYAIVIPQIKLEKRIYDLQNHSTKLSDLFVKIQAKIDEQKAKGKDTSVWQKNLDDTKVKVAVDMNTLATLLTKVVALKPSDYGTTSKATIESVNKDIKIVAKDFTMLARTLHRPAVLKNKTMVEATGTTTVNN